MKKKFANNFRSISAHVFGLHLFLKKKNEFNCFHSISHWSIPVSPFLWNFSFDASNKISPNCQHQSLFDVRIFCSLFAWDLKIKRKQLKNQQNTKRKRNNRKKDFWKKTTIIFKQQGFEFRRPILSPFFLF